MGGGPPRFPPDTTCPAVLTRRAHARPGASAYGTLTRSGGPFQRPSANTRPARDGTAVPSGAPVQPPRGSGGSLLAPHGFGLLPVRSPLLRESSLFLGVLRCFSSPGAPPLPRVPGRAPGGLPHSDTPRSQAASASLGRFAAWPRPSSAANAKASTVRPSSRPLHGHRQQALPERGNGSRTGARPRDRSPQADAIRPPTPPSSNAAPSTRSAVPRYSRTSARYRFSPRPTRRRGRNCKVRSGSENGVLRADGEAQASERPRPRGLGDPAHRVVNVRNTLASRAQR